MVFSEASDWSFRIVAKRAQLVSTPDFESCNQGYLQLVNSIESLKDLTFCLIISSNIKYLSRYLKRFLLFFFGWYFREDLIEHFIEKYYIYLAISIKWFSKQLFLRYGFHASRAAYKLPHFFPKIQVQFFCAPKEKTNRHINIYNFHNDNNYKIFLKVARWIDVIIIIIIFILNHR